MNLDTDRKDEFAFIEDDTALGLAHSIGFQSVERHQEDGDRFADEIEEDIEDKQPIYRNPYVRIGIAVAVISFILGFASLFSGNKEAVVVEDIETPVEEESELTLSLDGEAADDLDGRSEVDMLRTQVALLDQQLALAQVDRDNAAALRAQREAEEPATAAARSAARTAARPATPRTTTAPRPSSPAPTARPSTVRATARPAATRSVSPARITTRSPVQSRPPARVAPAQSAPRSVISQPAPEPVDPAAEWLAIANAGMMGNMPSFSPAEPVRSVKTQVDSGAEFELRNVDFRRSSTLQEAPAPTDSNVPGLLSPTPSFIPFGTAAKAEVAAPITWLSADDQFAIEVMEDVFDSEGNVSVPRGSFVIAQAAEINSNSGFGKLAAVGLQIGDEIISIDYRTVSIRGKGGDPLIAEQYGDIGGDIAGNDMEMFMIGAASGIGRELIKPRSQTVTSGNFGSVVSTDNGDRNLLGAILAGGTEQMVGRMGDRNDERLDNIRSRETIWYLPEGYEVQIYFNEDIQF